MTPQERDVLLPLLDRLRQTRAPVKDAEADQLIRQTVQLQPDAPYVLAQTVLMQDYALHAAEARLRALEQQVAQLQQAQQAQQAQQGQHGSGGGFLGGLLGGGRQAPPPPPPPGAYGYGQGYPQAPYGGAPSYGTGIANAFQPGGGGSSFLRGAAQTAAGVAGGMLLAQGIEDLFSQHHGGIGGGSGLMGDALGGNTLGGFGDAAANDLPGGPESVDRFVEQGPGAYDAGAYDPGGDAGDADDGGDYAGDSFDDGGSADDGLNG